MFDNSGTECFTRYINNPTPLRNLFCRFLEMMVPIYCLNEIILCSGSKLLKIVNDFMPLTKPWVVLFISYGWEMLRIILVKSSFIVHPTNSSGGQIYQGMFDLFMYSNVSIKYDSSQMCCMTFYIDDENLISELFWSI